MTTQNNKKALKISIAAILALVIFTFGFFVINAKLKEGTYSAGTIVAGINLSGETPETAQALLEQAQEGFLNKQIKITSDTKNITKSIQEFGVKIDTEKTLKLLENQVSQFELIPSAKPNLKNFELVTMLDRKQLEAVLEDSFSFSASAPKDATASLDATGQLVFTPESPGQVANIEKLANELRTNSASFIAKDLQLEVTKKNPEITQEYLQSQKDLLLEKLNHQVTLVDPIYSDDWYLKLKDKPTWVSFEVKKGAGENSQVQIKISQDELNKFVDAEISKWLDLPAETVSISKDSTGKVVIEGRGNDGYMVQRETLKEAIEIAINNKNKELVIPIKKIPAQINISKELQDLGIKERVAVGHSSYYGSPGNRVHNIKVGAQQFNGKLIAPDETFSFNENLGAVDASTGYRQELVIKAEGTIPEYGGGVCQVSTTLYRAILLSGLPVVDRRAHSYSVGYYSQTMGHGLDATIYLGGQDLKFKNDTGKHLLVQTYTKDDYELYVVFYGTSTGKTVELEGPYLSNYRSPGATIIKETTSLAPGQRKQVENAHTGFDAVWYRHITDLSGQKTSETISSRYRAVPAKVLVGAAAASTEIES